MKKLLIILLSALSLTAFAQNVKKVAILETVDKVGDVPYGVKLQVRMSLTDAISRTSGYEGYDRVDMSSIIGEQNFQRTGMVSNAQIKKLGEMTGAQYVLIAEAAIYDAQNIIITAKVLDVETGGVTNSAPPAFANKDPEKMQAACVTLAQKLLGGSIIKDISESKSTHYSQQGNIQNTSNNNQSIAQNGTAKIILSRPFSSSGWNNMGATHMLYFDGQLFGNIPSTIYYEVIVEPGKHTIEGYIGNSSPDELRRAGAAYSLTIDAVKDNTYYACIDDKKKTLILVSRENHEKDLNQKYMPLKWAGKLELRGDVFYDMNGNPVGENAHKARDNQ